MGCPKAYLTEKKIGNIWYFSLSEPLVSYAYVNVLKMYRIGLPSNTATPVALFVQIELLCFCSCIPQQTCVATNTAIAAHIEMVLVLERTTD